MGLSNGGGEDSLPVYPGARQRRSAPIRLEAPDSGNRRGWVATNARDEGFRGGKCAEVEARRIAPSGVGSEMRDGDPISAQLGWELFDSRSVAAILYHPAGDGPTSPCFLS